MEWFHGAGGGGGGGGGGPNNPGRSRDGERKVSHSRSRSTSEGRLFEMTREEIFPPPRPRCGGAPCRLRLLHHLPPKYQGCSAGNITEFESHLRSRIARRRHAR